MDNVTEKEVMKNLLDYLTNKTILIIAHRLETIKDVDEIFVLDGGAIVEEGSYQSLIKKDGYFKKLYNAKK